MTNEYTDFPKTKQWPFLFLWYRIVVQVNSHLNSWREKAMSAYMYQTMNKESESLLCLPVEQPTRSGWSPTLNDTNPEADFTSLEESHNVERESVLKNTASK